MEALKIFYNGFKVGSEKELHKAYIDLSKDSEGNEYVCIYAKDYNRIPRGYFYVRNDTDLMTDYFDTDSARVYPDHPLYKYLRYAALKSDYMHLKRELSKLSSGKRCWTNRTVDELKSLISEFEALEDVGQPKKEDFDAIEEMQRKAEEARKEAERKAEEAREAEYFMERLETEMTIHEATEEFPVVEGRTYVKVLWSERNGIEDNSVWSLRAAEKIFSILDERQHSKEHGGYDKTKFEIHYTSGTEESTYTGRYDIGDGEGGLLKHIFNFGEYYRTHDEFGHVLEKPEITNDVLEIWKLLTAKFVCE